MFIWEPVECEQHAVADVEANEVFPWCLLFPTWPSILGACRLFRYQITVLCRSIIHHTSDETWCGFVQLQVLVSLLLVSVQWVLEAMGLASVIAVLHQTYNRKIPSSPMGIINHIYKANFFRGFQVWNTIDAREYSLIHRLRKTSILVQNSSQSIPDLRWHNIQRQYNCNVNDGWLDFIIIIIQR